MTLPWSRSRSQPGRALVTAAAAGLAVLLLAAACGATPDASSGPVVAATGTSPGPGAGTASTGLTPSSRTTGTSPGPVTGPVDPERVLSADGGVIGHDRALPDIGHAGYDVDHYDLDLTFDPARGHLSGTARLDVRAVDALTAMVLDLRGLDVTGVKVDDAATTFRVSDRTLTLDLPPSVTKGASFRVSVDYGGRPRPVPTDALNGIEVGWHSGSAGSVVMSEPEGASSWYPVNNHPLDKATYAIAVTVPEPLTAIANGRLERTEAHAGTRTFHWVMDKPMANYLASVVTGDLEEIRGATAGGVTYSSWVPRGHRAADDGRQAVDGLAARLGPFPFSTYGSVVYLSDYLAGSEDTRQFLSGIALETQGRSLFSESAGVSRTLIHEAAHQWMGDSVSLTDWSRDIWWVEGFARFAEVAITPGDQPLEPEMFRASERQCGDETAGDIPVTQLFSSRSYDCGALVFYALYRHVGADTFWSIMRTFNEQFRYRNASTDDLVEVASKVAGQDLGPFFADWLFSPDRPDLP